MNHGANVSGRETRAGSCLQVSSIVFICLFEKGKLLIENGADIQCVKKKTPFYSGKKAQYLLNLLLYNCKGL